MYPVEGDAHAFSISVIKLFFTASWPDCDNIPMFLFDENKVYDAHKLRDDEAKHWLDIWGVTVVKLTLHRFPAFAMPFVLTAEDSERFGVTAAHLASALIGQAPHPDNVAALEPLAQQLQGAVGKDHWTPKRALEAAARSMAEKGLEHSDLAWHHVGLLPVFDRSGCIAQLQPILIDLEYVSHIGEASEASRRLHDMLQESP
jgi:hypothetical protein